MGVVNHGTFRWCLYDVSTKRNVVAAGLGAVPYVSPLADTLTAIIVILSFCPQPNLALWQSLKNHLRYPPAPCPHGAPIPCRFSRFAARFTEEPRHASRWRQINMAPAIRVSVTSLSPVLEAVSSLRRVLNYVADNIPNHVLISNADTCVHYQPPQFNCGLAVLLANSKGMVYCM